MVRSELSPQTARALRIDAIRNHAASPGVVFSPYDGLNLTYADGSLCRVQGAHKTPLASVNDILAMDDDEIDSLVEAF